MAKCALKHIDAPVAVANEAPADTNSRTKLRFQQPALERVQVDGDFPRDVLEEWGAAPLFHSRRAESGVIEVEQGDVDGDCMRATIPSTAQRPAHHVNAQIYRAQVREYVIDDEALLYDPAARVLYYLNQTAFAVWRRCEGRTIRELASRFTHEYDVDRATVTMHIRQIVELFALGGLLSVETTDAHRA